MSATIGSLAEAAFTAHALGVQSIPEWHQPSAATTSSAESTVGERHEMLASLGLPLGAWSPLRNSPAAFEQLGMVGGYISAALIVAGIQASDIDQPTGGLTISNALLGQLWPKAPGRWQTIAAQIDAFRDLDASWAGDDGEPPSAQTVENARLFIELLRHRNVSPPSAVSADADGEISIRWRDGSATAGVSFLNDGHIVGYVKGNEGFKEKLDEPFAMSANVLNLIYKLRTLF